MGKYDIELKDWYVLKDEAVRYLDRVASEIRIRASTDPFISRIRVSTNFVEAAQISGTSCRCTFQFEMDRGRPFKGHYYEVTVHRGVCEGIRRLGSRDPLYNNVDLVDLSGENLMEAIRMFMLYDVENA